METVSSLCNRVFQNGCRVCSRAMGLSSVLFMMTACGGGSTGTLTHSEPTPSPTPIPSPSTAPSPITAPPTGKATLPMPAPQGIETDDQVTLTKSTYEIRHWSYSTNADNTLASVNYNRLESTHYDTWVLENRYLKITLVPEFGGRIVSILNKVTGHEELYQNPVGSPYFNQRGIFYYDWLMFLGGIFPTFPEPEHGKAWLLPWEVEIVQAGGDMATLRMSYQDSTSFGEAPAPYRYGTTQMICTFTVSLEAGRTAMDTVITLENPTDSNKNYEFWMNTAPAPGSVVGNTALNDSYEIIADIDALAPPRSAPGAPYGISNDGTDTHWDSVKFFRNHERDGIAYPDPNIAHSNFWGAINQNNKEGFFRVADNTLTPGLKIFTFGHDNTLNAHPEGETNNQLNWERPAVELWAGVSNQFFVPATLAANTFFHIEASYSPSVGMANVTHASDDVLLNRTNGALELYFMTPDQMYELVIEKTDETLVGERITPNAKEGHRIEGDFSNMRRLTVKNSIGIDVLDLNF